MRWKCTRARRALSLFASVLLSLQLLGVEAPRALAESLAEVPIEAADEPISEVEVVHEPSADKNPEAISESTPDDSSDVLLSVQGDDDTLDPITYTDGYGNTCTTTEYTTLSGETDADTIEPGVYYVTSSMKFNNRVTCEGDLTFVLAPGVALSCYSGIDIAADKCLQMIGTPNENGEYTSSVNCRSQTEGVPAINGDGASVFLYCLNVSISKCPGSGAGIKSDTLRILNNCRLSIATHMNYANDSNALVVSNLSLYDNAYVLYGRYGAYTSPGPDRVTNSLNTVELRIYPCPHAVIGLDGSGFKYEDEQNHRFSCPECELTYDEPHVFDDDGYCTAKNCSARNVVIEYYQNFAGGSETAYATSGKVMHYQKNAYIKVEGASAAGNRECYEFDGWNPERDGSGYPVRPDKNLHMSQEVDGNPITLNGLINRGYVVASGGQQTLRLFAQWKRVAHKVTFDTNGASEVEPQIVAFDATVTEPEAPVWGDFTFGGWYADEALTVPFEFGRTIDSDITVYAKWAVTRTVYFDSNFGSGNMDSVNVENGEAYTLPTCEFTPPSGKCFYGWKEANTDKVMRAGTTYRPTDNVHLLAVWNDIIPYVDSDGADGGVCEDYVEIADVPAEQTTLTEGWYVVKKHAGESEFVRNARMKISGDVNLILCDDATFTTNEGIRVPAGASLTIWGQKDGSGKLFATTTDPRTAAIGGNHNEGSGDVTINGGTVEACGHQSARAIGGGTENYGDAEASPRDSVHICSTAKVKAGAQAGNATLAGFAERNEAPRANVYVLVEPCDHPDGYHLMSVNHEQHAQKCQYCGAEQGERSAHSFDEETGLCACGETRGDWTLEEVKDEGEEYAHAVRAVYTPDGGEPSATKPLVTVAVEDKVYDGTEALATIVKDDDFPSQTTIMVSNVRYYDESGETLDGSPSEVGNYSAGVTVKVLAFGYGEVELRKPFSITKMESDVNVTARNLAYSGKPQNLVQITGDASHGKVYMRLSGSSSWGTTIPQAINVGDYEVEWFFSATDTHYQSIGSRDAPKTVYVTIDETPHSHDGVPFNIAWNDPSTLPTEPGNYYLDCDVTLESNWSVTTADKWEEDALNICLNGHTLEGNYHQMSVSGPAVVGIWSDGGTITHLSGPEAGLFATQNATVDLYELTISDCNGGSNGSVAVDYGATLGIHGGEIKDCGGPAVYVGNQYYVTPITGQYISPKLVLYGSPVIEDNIGSNVFLVSTGSTRIGGEIGDDARVSFDLGTRETGVLTSGWSTYNEGKDPGKVFFCDARPQLLGDNLYVGLSNGEAAIMTHVHNWQLSLSDDESTATIMCVADGCEEFGTNEPYTVSIAADAASVEEDGDGHGATVTRSNLNRLPGDPSISGAVPLDFSMGDIEYWEGDHKLSGPNELHYETNDPYWPGTYEARFKLKFNGQTYWIKSAPFEITAKQVVIPESSVTAVARENLRYNEGKQIELCDFTDWVEAQSLYFRVDGGDWKTYNRKSAAEAGIPSQYQAQYNASTRQLPKASSVGTHLVEYYILGNGDQWQDYGSEEEPLSLEVFIGPSVDPAFKKQQLTLTGQIALTAYLDLPSDCGVDWASSYVELEVGGKRHRKETVSYDQSTYNSDRTLHGFSIQLSSIEMAEPVQVTLHYMCGDQELTLAKEGGISVKGYVEAYDNSQSSYPPVVTTLVHSIADYGHWVQPFLAKSNKWTVGEQYAEMSKFYTESYDANDVLSNLTDYSMSKTLEDGCAVSKATASLSLDSETTIDVLLTIADGVEPQISSVTLNGVPRVCELTQLPNKRWRVRVPGLRATQLGNELKVVGTAGGGGFTVTASGLAYVRAALGLADKDGSHAAMCSVYQYHKAAYNYYNSVYYGNY